MRSPNRGLSALILTLAVVSCRNDSAGPDGALTLSAGSYDFGEAEVGQPSAPFVLTVTNGGTRSTGTLSAHFNSLTGQFLLGQDQCSGHVLTRAGSCQIQITMRTGVPGPAQVVLIVSDGLDSASAVVKGTGFSRGILLVPDNLDFGQGAVGTESAPQTLRLENRGTIATGKLSLQRSGDAADFEITNDGCTGQQLPPQGSCDVELRFKPQTAGAKDAYLFVAGTGSELTSAELTGES